MSLAILLAMCFGYAPAANGQTYSECLRQMYDSDIMGASAAEVISSMKGLVGSDIDSPLAQQYIKEQMLTDMVELMQPYFEANISEDELKAVFKEYEKPEVQTASKHIKESLTSVSGDVIEELKTAAMRVIMGEKLQPMTLKEGISSDFRAACDNYFKQTDALSGVEIAVENILKSVPDEAMKAKLSVLADYVKESIPVMFTNACNGRVSMQDLSVMTALSETPAQKNYNQAIKAWLADALNFGQAMKGKWEAYKKANPAEK